MFQTHPPVSVPDISGNSALDPSTTAGMILHPVKSQEYLPELTNSQTLTVVPNDERSSSILVKSLFTSILEDVMTQLWILETCNNELALVKTTTDIDYLKSIKYGVYSANDVKDELDGIDVKNLNCNIYKVNKLMADRKFVNNVMHATYLGLAQSGTIEPLVSFITSMMEVDHHRIYILEEENKNKIIRKDLSKQVRQQRNHIKTVLYDTEVIIDKLKTQVEDSVLYAEVGYRYIDNWQEARTEQHTLTILDSQNKPSTEIEYYKQRTDHELRVHNEVETLVSITITETLHRIEDWMDKFEKDMEKIDLKIQVKKNEYQDKLDTNIQYEEMLKTHELDMKNWLQFKQERETARLYHEKMTNSALIVQAWWRGIIVRLQLGPYKTKKPKKGKKAKSYE